MCEARHRERPERSVQSKSPGDSEAEPSLRHLSQHLVSTLAMPSPFESTGEVWGEAGDGLTQGDGESSGNYGLATHPELRELDRDQTVYL